LKKGIFFDEKHLTIFIVTMFQRIILALCSLFAKTIGLASRILKKGSGTSIPGYLVERYYPQLLGPLLSQYSETIAITGTNGKTTTRSMIVQNFEANGENVVTNLGGANIIRGIASSLLLNLNWTGKAKSNIAVLEVEEASLPILTKYCKLNTLILTNIFRDQLDAYGEIDTTLNYFTRSINQGQPDTIITNTDDLKLLSSIPRHYQDRIVGFGIQDEAISLPKFEESNSQSPIFPISFFRAIDVKIYNQSSHLTIETTSKNIETTIKLPGVYNIYNGLAAIALCYPRFGQSSLRSIEKFTPAFGRGEAINIEDTTIQLMLIKNPVGFQQVLQHIQAVNQQKSVSLAILINDKIADGKDVSWLWDTEVESFIENQSIQFIRTGGSRGLDMLLRLKYAGLSSVQKSMNIENTEDLAKSLISHPGLIYVLATYTALLELRKELQKYTKIPDISDKGN
jgi:lipid II isoglutaminyl synthase (glutamine-hydrolysing)